jgi:phosphatidate cytidylyltransferase
MKQRIFSFLLLWVLVLGVPSLLGQTGVILLVVIFALLTQFEIYKLLQAIGPRPHVGLGLAMGVLVSLGTFSGGAFGLMEAYGVAIVVLIIAFLPQLPAQRTFSNIGATIFGLTFAPFLLGFLSEVVLLAGVPTAIWLVGVTKFADVGGLLAGMAFGKHKLAPKLSPKKTWEGVIGGVASSILVGVLAVVLAPEYFPSELTPLMAGLFAVPLAISGICSDLFESAMKREAKTKDAGKIFPGIGGAFDLTDSILLASPVGFALLRLILT